MVSAMSGGVSNHSTVSDFNDSSLHPTDGSEQRGRPGHYDQDGPEELQPDPEATVGRGSGEELPPDTESRRTDQAETPDR